MHRLCGDTVIICKEGKVPNSVITEISNPWFEVNYPLHDNENMSLKA